MHRRIESKKFRVFVTICILNVLSNFSCTLFSHEPTNPDPSNQQEIYRKIDPTLQALALFLSTYIKHPLWSNTRVPAVRDILYLMPHKFSAKKNIQMAVNLFYNEIHNMRITVSNLLQTNTLENEQELLDLFLENINNPDDRTAILYFFRKISLQERRLGFFVQTKFKKGPFAAHIHTPLFIDERNCWLSLRETKKLLRILQLKLSDIPIKEFYRLKFGVGDTKIAFGFDDLKAAHWKLNVGFQATVPTSKLSYSPKYTASVENVTNISDIEELKQAMLRIARNIRNYLLDPRFGNSGHFGIGLYGELKKSFFDKQIHFWAKISLDTLFAANQDRLFFFKQTVSTDMLDIGLQAYNYLKQYVFPTSFNVRVHPGNIIHAILATSTNIGKYDVTVGYDFYEQQHESIKKINNSSETLSNLKVKDAESLSALQHKFFAEALYKHRTPVTLGVGGDVAIASTNMGNDWTVYAKATLLF